MQCLHDDILDKILCDYITKFRDITTVELVCKKWFNISRKRTRLTNRTRILNPDVLDRFPNLLTVDGCFNDIQPLFKSKLRRFDYILMPIPSPVVLYMPSLSIGEIIKSYAASEIKPEVRIYSYFAHSLIYIFTPQKVTQFCDDVLSIDLNDNITKYMGDKVEIEIYIASDNLRLLQRFKRIDHLIFEHNPGFAIDDVSACAMIESHLALLSKSHISKVTIVTTSWWRMRYKLHTLDDKISMSVQCVRKKEYPLTTWPCQKCAAFPCEECNLCPGNDCQACRCYAEPNITDIFEDTLIEETDQTVSCNLPILKWLAALFKLDRLSPN